jgi:hypothetical protein
MSESRTFSVTVKDCLVNLLALGDLYEAIATGESDNGFRIRADEAAAVMRASAHFISDFASDIGFSKWVSVEERLPERNEQVLVIDECGVTVGSYSPMLEDWWSLRGDRMAPGPVVTHWMPLPSPTPKKD